jgi:16S rRNA (uracil1498-N3)-methyltransferase
MTRRRWIADKVEGDRAFLLDNNANHLFRVLRAQTGQQYDVVADGVARLGTITFASPDKVEFHLGEEIAAEALPEITVYLSIFKFDHMEWAMEKMTELGVTRIVPVVAARTSQHLIKAAEKRVDRWRKIAKEASQQARRVAPPEIADAMKLGKAVVEATQSQTRIVLSEIEESVSLKAVLAGTHPPLVMAFGPEGGWTDEELEHFKTNAWRSATLGHTILRAETAAIAAVAVAVAEIGN